MVELCLREAGHSGRCHYGGTAPPDACRRPYGAPWGPLRGVVSEAMRGSYERGGVLYVVEREGSP